MDGMGNDLSQFSPTKKISPQNNVAINLGKYMLCIIDLSEMNNI